MCETEIATREYLLFISNLLGVLLLSQRSLQKWWIELLWNYKSDELNCYELDGVYYCAINLFSSGQMKGALLQIWEKIS